MKSFTRTGSHLFCGHWNGSQLEIGLTELLLEVPCSERRHCHDYHEYYIVLEGEGILEVEGAAVPLQAGSTVMVEPGERHQLVAVGPAGLRWAIVKERSEPGSKNIR